MVRILNILRPLIFGKTVIKKFLVAKDTCFYCASNAGLLRLKPGETSARLFGCVTTRWKNEIYMEFIALPTDTSLVQFCFTFHCAFYQAKLIILEKTLNQKYQSRFARLSHMMRLDLASFVLKTERANRCAMQYFTLVMVFFTKIYTRFDGFSTPTICFWLICTTRRWDRESV